MPHDVRVIPIDALPRLGPKLGRHGRHPPRMAMNLVVRPPLRVGLIADAHLAGAMMQFVKPGGRRPTWKMVV